MTEIKLHVRSSNFLSNLHPSRMIHRALQPSRKEVDDNRGNNSWD